jgi:hypothetical protein
MYCVLAMVSFLPAACSGVVRLPFQTPNLFLEFSDPRHEFQDKRIFRGAWHYRSASAGLTMREASSRSAVRCASFRCNSDGFSIFGRRRLLERSAFDISITGI